MSNFEECNLCGVNYVGVCVHTYDDDEDLELPRTPPRGQAMPETVEAYKALAARDLELIMEQKEEISRLKQKVNKLEQKR